MNVACNCLVKGIEKRLVAGPWLIAVDNQTGKVMEVNLLEGHESAFTQWLGGTIVISPFDDVDISTRNQTMWQWIDRLAPAGEDMLQMYGYAWHLPACMPDALVDVPRRIS